MRHLQTFENIDEYNFKKYLVWQAKKILMVLELKDVARYHIKWNKLYTYNKSGEIKRIKNEMITIFKDNKIKRHILYESDDLQSCIDMLETLSVCGPAANKYNI